MNRSIALIPGLVVMVILMTSCGSNNSKSSKNLSKALSTNDSIALLTSEIQKDSAEYNLWKQRSILYLKNGSVDFAFRDVGKALDLNSEDPELYILLSDIYFTIGKVDNSLSAIKKAISLEPGNPEGYLKMASFKLILENYKQASAYADKVIAINPESANAYYIKAISSLGQKDTANAITLMKIAANLDTSFFAANLNLGIVLDARGDTSARSYFQKAVKIKPNNIIARYSLGMFYQKQKQFSRALKTYDELIELHPDNAEAHFNKGYIYLTEFLKFEQAEEEFKKAIEIKSDYTAAVFNLGRTYEIMGDTTLAKQKYREALKLTTNYSLAIEGLNRLE